MPTIPKEDSWVGGAPRQKTSHSCYCTPKDDRQRPSCCSISHSSVLTAFGVLCRAPCPQHWACAGLASSLCVCREREEVRTLRPGAGCQLYSQIWAWSLEHEPWLLTNHQLTLSSASPSGWIEAKDSQLLSILAWGWSAQHPLPALEHFKPTPPPNFDSIYFLLFLFRIF